MEVKSINSEKSSFHQNNKYIEYINKDNNIENLQTNIIENIKKDIIKQLYSKFDNLNKNFNDKLEEIRKNMNEANIQINNQLKNILIQINKNNVQENFNNNIKNRNIIKEKEENKVNKNETKYKKMNTCKNSTNNNYCNLNNANEERILVKNNYKNIVKDNTYLLNQNQNNEVKREKEINPQKEKEGETEIEKERDEFDLQSINIKNNKNKRIPINPLKRANTKQENIHNRPINIKMSDNESFFNKNINYMTNDIDNSNIKYLNSETIPKEQNSNKIYQSINNIFFVDYQQKCIKEQKINEYQIEELKKEIFNDKKKGRNFLKNYYMNYIEENILPLFKKNINPSKQKVIQEIIKYNICIILECLGMDKNYYNNYFYQQEAKQPKFSRCQSKEAVIKFRKEFNISQDDFTDEALEKKLIENNLDIHKTFGKIFG